MKKFKPNTSLDTGIFETAFGDCQKFLEKFLEAKKHNTKEEFKRLKELFKGYNFDGRLFDCSYGVCDFCVIFNGKKIFVDNYAQYYGYDDELKTIDIHNQPILSVLAEEIYIY